MARLTINPYERSDWLRPHDSSKISTQSLSLVTLQIHHHYH